MKSGVLAGGVALVLAVGVAACTGSASDGGSSATRPAPVPTRLSSSVPPVVASTGPSIRIDRPISRILDVDDAVKAETSVQDRVVLSSTDDPRLAFLGLSGRDVLAVRVPHEPDGTTYARLTRTTSIGTWTSGRFHAVTTSVPESRGPLRGRQRQVIAMTRAGDQLVWVETASTDLEFAEWSIRRADLATGRVEEVAHSAELAGGARLIDVVGGTYPVVLGAWVYWATAVPLVPDPNPRQTADWRFDVQRTSLREPGTPQTVAQDAVMPAALGHELVYASYQRKTADTYEIHARDVMGDDTDRVLARGYRSGSSWLSGLAASGDLLAWTAQSPSLAKEGFVPGESESGVLFVMDVPTGEVTAVRVRGDAGADTALAFTSRGVVWAAGSGSGDDGEYVYDTSSHRILRLGANEGLSQVLADPASDRLLWIGDAKGSDEVIWQLGTLG